MKPLNGFNFDEKANEFSPLKSEAAVFQPHAQEFKSSANEKFHISPYAKEYKLESLEFKPSFLSGFDSERQNKIFAPSNEELERYFKPKLSASASEFNLK